MKNKIVVGILSVALGAALLMAANQEVKKSESLKLTLSLDKDTYTLGEMMEAEVKLENTSSQAVEINEFVFEERSVSFEIAFDLGGITRKTFTYAVTKPDAYIANRVPPTRVTLKAGRMITELFAIPAIKTGKWDITAKFAGADAPVTSNKVAVEVKPQGSATKLYAQIELKGQQAGDMGTLEIELLPEAAPNTVMNFVNLVNKRFYDDLLVHRITKNWVAQMGCPLGNGMGGPGYSIRDEASGSTLMHDRGTVSMCHYSKEAEYTGSQFFVSFVKLPVLDKKYTIFGKVADLKVLDALEKVDVEHSEKALDRPLQAVAMKKVKIVAK